VAFVIVALPQRIYSLRRDNLRILAMPPDQQGRSAPDVDSGAIVSIRPASLDRLSFEYLVTLGEGDPALLAARPDMPGRLQPRGIIERPRADANHTAAR
jgi:hypothetical protein